MKTVYTLFISFIISMSAFSQTNAFSSTNGVAIKGFDPVAYFMQGKATEGTDSYTTDWSGSKWKFSSQANLDLFKANPEKYAPQFGGYCAYGCSEKHKSPTDPNAFTIVNDKLYLNYNLKVMELWRKDTASRIPAAIEYWKSNQ